MEKEGGKERVGDGSQGMSRVTSCFQLRKTHVIQNCCSVIYVMDGDYILVES